MILSFITQGHSGGTLLCLFCFCTAALHAQDTLVQLPPVLFEQVENPLQVQRFVLDSARLAPFRGLNLAEALSRSTPLHVKEYGLGNIATLSARGGQAALFWEGLPLQQLSLGQSDLSLIPSALFDQAELRLGLGADHWGNGSLGGAVHLRSAVPKPGWHGQLSQQLGSFGRQQRSFSLSYAQPARRFARLSLWQQSGEHDFGYRHQGQLRRQQHAQMQQYGGQLGLSAPLFSGQWTSWLWAQRSRRNIPPTLLQLRGTDRQWDEQLRWIQRWERQHLGLKLGYVREYLRFESPGILSENRTQLLFVEGHWRQGPWQVALQQWGLWARLNSYTQGQAQQARTALQFGYQSPRHGRWGQWVFSLRQETYYGPYLQPAALLSWEKAWQSWAVQASAGQQYRLPSFNDWYWQPGGNPNLQAEYSRGGQLAINYQNQDPVWRLNARADVYSYWVENWIQWQPNAQSSWWEANNLPWVWSRGLEAQGSLEHHSDKGQWGLRLQYSLNVVNARRAQASWWDLSQQLIYSPLHQLNAQLWWQRGRWHWHYQHNWTDLRFLTTDHSAYLPAYALAHTQFRYQFAPFEAFVQLNNVWNTDYQVMSQRPMPRRYVSVGLYCAW